MKIFLLFSMLGTGIFTLIICLMLIKYVQLAEKYASLKSYFKRLSHVINSARYGNFETRMDEAGPLFVKELTINLNKLFESVLDRDLMINEYIQKEKETNNLKEDFIATLTHDLKVPIIAQDNTLELLLNGKFGNVNESQEFAIKNLKTSNMDLKYMVEALLETYKMEHSGIQVEKEKDINVSLFIRDIINQLQIVAQSHDKQLNLILEISDNFCIDMDTFLIRRVVNNLILNALLHSIDSKNIDIIVRADNKFVYIDIKDYGIGIEKEEIEKIFKKYYTGSSKFLRSGTGLGLYLSNKIVNEHGGYISVDSVMQQGSTFTIALNI